MSRRIAIVGTHSTGKSTLIQDLKKYFEENSITEVDFIKQVNRECPKYGLKINEEADDLTQLYIAANDLKQIVEFPKNKDLISDRCILDTFIYSKSMYQDKGQISEFTLDAVQAIAANSLEMYTDFVWLRPEFNVVPDGVRSEDETWRLGLDLLFEDAFKDLEALDVIPVTLTGTPEERVQQFIEKVWNKN